MLCVEADGKGAGGGDGGGEGVVGAGVEVVVADFSVEPAVGAIFGVQPGSRRRNRKERKKIFLIIAVILAFNIAKITQIGLLLEQVCGSSSGVEH